MLGGGGGDGGAAKRQEALELERRNKVEAGTQQVRNTFGTFDDPYYAGRRGDYMAHYQPQLDEQIAEALRRLPLNFSNTANSAYQQKLADLTRDTERERVNLGTAADSFVGAHRADIGQQEQQLYGLAQAGSDPSSIALQAGNMATSLATPAAFAALPDLFAKYTGNMVNQKIANDGNVLGTQQNARSLMFPTSKNKAASYVTK